jgi:hypothetical protein
MAVRRSLKNKFRVLGSKFREICHACFRLGFEDPYMFRGENVRGSTRSQLET